MIDINAVDFSESFDLKDATVGLIGQGSNAVTTANLSSIHLREFRGIWSATTAAMPGTVSKADVSGWTTGGHPYLWMGSR